MDARHGVVVTYSSCLALIYFAAETQQLTREAITADSKRGALYEGLATHPGIGLVLTRSGDGVHAASEKGRALIREWGARPSFREKKTRSSTTRRCRTN